MGQSVNTKSGTPFSAGVFLTGFSSSMPDEEDNFECSNSGNSSPQNSNDSYGNVADTSANGSSSDGKNNNGSQNEDNNDKKRKTSGKKTNTYIEKRRKNNEAAKRSREKKRKRECLL